MWLATSTRYEVRPEQVFDGIGDRASPRSRYREQHSTVQLSGGATLGALQAGVAANLEQSSFGPARDTSGGEPSIEQAYATRSLVGFDRGVRTMEALGEVALDTRPSGRTGLTARGFFGGVPAGASYLHGGAEITESIDLYAGNRILVLRGAVEGVAGSSSGIPFSRLPRLGGPERLRGYRLDRYRDRTSALASVEYRYPIHAAVAGALFLDAGHVGPDIERLTAVTRWRAGGGAAIRVQTKGETLLSVELAYGDGVQLLLSVFPFDDHHPEAP